ncbi:MAG: hypothetical protein JNL70_18280 [Saprospiraceae bacterium]|nr:hypothetical protein [Saprospiraceae bacterium]
MREKELDEPDIICKIHADFKEEDLAEAIAIFAFQYKNVGIVGSAQFVRSLIFLSKGDLNFLKNYILKNHDPREVVMEAENAAGNLGHWFGISFDEFDDYEKSVHSYWESIIQAEEDFNNVVKEDKSYWDFLFQAEKEFEYWLNRRDKNYRDSLIQDWIKEQNAHWDSYYQAQFQAEKEFEDWVKGEKNYWDSLNQV